MTATDGHSAEIDSAARLERACSAAANGRRAARALADWTKRFGLTEAEFQFLWRLRPTSGDGPNQTTLAGSLVFSPAQISAIVERMRQRGLISERGTIGDRRRNYWQLSAAGRELLDQMQCAAASLHFDSTPLENNPQVDSGANRRREAAA